MMPSHKPTTVGEHTGKAYPRRKPWIARRKRGVVCYHLGYFETRDEAEQAEAHFDEVFPSRKHVRS